MLRVVRLRAVVERHHPRMPRYVVVASSKLAPWRLTGTTIVEGTLAGVPLGRRSLKRWDAERWFLELPERWCRRAGISTGDRGWLELELASTDLPEELARLLEESAPARSCWERMTPSRRRIVREEVLAAKRPETRRRRARKALVPE